MLCHIPTKKLIHYLKLEVQILKRRNRIIMNTYYLNNIHYTAFWLLLNFTWFYIHISRHVELWCFSFLPLCSSDSEIIFIHHSLQHTFMSLFTWQMIKFDILSHCWQVSFRISLSIEKKKKGPESRPILI